MSAGDSFTVALAVSQGFTARVLLDGRLVPLLREAGARVGVLAPPLALPAIAARFRDPGITCHPLYDAESRADLVANYGRLLVADWRATTTFALREAERWQARGWRRA